MVLETNGGVELAKLTASRSEQIFPFLSSTQMQRLVAHGDARSVRAGEVLVEPGGREIPILLSFLVNWKQCVRHLVRKH